MREIHKSKIYKGYVDFRDDELAKGLKEGGIIVWVENEYMKLTPSDLIRKRKQRNDFHKFPSYYNKPYYLWSYEWQPEEYKPDIPDDEEEMVKQLGL